VAAIKALRWRTLILDGEVAVYDQQLVSRFEWLRGRPEDEVSTPTMFMAFDCLQWDEADVRLQPLHARRHLLEGVLDGVPPVLFPVRRLSDDGLKAWQQVIEQWLRGSRGEGSRVTLTLVGARSSG
jgi:ATP-dependent DNA ligase